MYYESRENRLQVTAGRGIDLAKMIKKLRVGQAIRPDSLGLIFVNDQPPDSYGRIKEVAILRRVEGSIYQIESLTVDWMTDEELGDYLLSLEKKQLAGELQFMHHRRTTFNDRDALVSFTCGCCGRSFQSTRAKQEPFDQDAGYGICPNCA